MAKTQFKETISKERFEVMLLYKFKCISSRYFTIDNLKYCLYYVDDHHVAIYAKDEGWLFDEVYLITQFAPSALNLPPRSPRQKRAMTIVVNSAMSLDTNFSYNYYRLTDKERIETALKLIEVKTC